MSSTASTTSSNGYTSPLPSYLSSKSSKESIVNMNKLYQRLNILEYENQKLMESHEMLVSEVNRRSEMHIMEVSKLHRRINETEAVNQELKALCSMYENEAKKARVVVKENDKIRKYFNEFIKQELRIFADKTRELSINNEQLLIENKELKRLCLYLDEQRFDIINISKKHTCSNCQKVQEDIFECSDNITSNDKNEKENRIEMLTKEMQTSLCLMKDNDEDSAIITTSSNDSTCNENTKNNELLSYIYYLENRINNLEMGVHKPFSQMSSEFESNDEDNDLIRVSPLLMKKKNQLTKDLSNGSEIKILSDVCVSDVEMPSSNKLFNNINVNDTGNCINIDKEGNHEHDCIVYGGCHNFNECISNNFVRFLSKIDEDEEISNKSNVKNSLSDILTDLSSSQSPNSFTFEIPPPMADVSESIGRLSFCSSSNNSLNSIINTPNNINLIHNSYHPTNECYYEEIRVDNKLSSPIYTPISKIAKNINENSENGSRTSLGYRRQPSSNRRSVSMNNGVRRNIIDNEVSKLPPIRLRTGHLQNNTTSPTYYIPSEEDKRILQRACQLQFNQKLNKKENQKGTKILVDQKSGNIKAELTAI
uniref:HAP1 N-terminal domain-containing protein n=1 Tax=Strongyloides papillosus TaxID=174720 RepID=A0A0N5BN82_STREA